MFPASILEVIERLLGVHMAEGGLIMDPFTGTGGNHPLEAIRK